jgi:hypothetical protein
MRIKMLLLPISTLLFLAQVFSAHASLFCMRLEQLSEVSDVETLRLLEAHISAFNSSKPLLIREIDRALISQNSRRFFMILPDEENCKSSGCYYRLLELKDGVIKETFSFHGTGVFWYYSPVAVRVEYFQDDFEILDLETSTQTYIRLGLPRKGNSVYLAALSAEQAKLPRTCGTGSK